MTEPLPTTKGRKVFNAFAAFILLLFVLFCVAMTIGVASIPKLRDASHQDP
ncbi:MAG TPA: hypothetical protein VJU16_02280 [Planctomycetota bacterium]|nr:hypothetical protein [Planctomycetota bacterium]